MLVKEYKLPFTRRIRSGALMYSRVITVNNAVRGAWGAQSIKCLTLDFCSGHDLRVMRSSPTSGSTMSVEPA